MHVSLHLRPMFGRYFNKYSRKTHIFQKLTVYMHCDITYTRKNLTPCQQDVFATGL